MYTFYRLLTFLSTPFVGVLLAVRRKAGKEDPARMGERLGKAGVARPAGKLLWIHAASVGETNSILPLIESLLAAAPDAHVLLTTVTVTSAALSSTRLPARAIHQFAPVDTPQAVSTFLDHWQPDAALWVDSELWPNLIIETAKRGTKMGIVNARMSERSFRRWCRFPSLAQRMLSCFTLCFAQTEIDADRLRALGLRHTAQIGNLKYDAAVLPADEEELNVLRTACTGRAVWLAASTHPGEEKKIGEVHEILAMQGIKLLTIIVPRHAARGAEIVASLAGGRIAVRSLGQPLVAATEIYLADTMGELGLFYRLAPLVFIGGSLVPHGGQNPLEAARLGCAIILGPHMENFQDIASQMQQDGACIRVEDSTELAIRVAGLLNDVTAREALAAAAREHVQARCGTLARLMNELRPFLA